MSDYVTDVGPVIVDGEIIAATLISRDITDRKRAEEALREDPRRSLRQKSENVPPNWPKPTRNLPSFKSLPKPRAKDSAWPISMAILST